MLLRRLDQLVQVNYFGIFYYVTEAQSAPLIRILMQFSDTMPLYQLHFFFQLIIKLYITKRYDSMRYVKCYFRH